MRMLAAGLLAAAGCAWGQCAGYAHAFNVTVPAASVTASLAGFTVTIAGTYAGSGNGGLDLRQSASGGMSQSAGGYDIAFQAGGANLTWSMPDYVGTTGRVRANVLMTATLNATTATVFQLCVGKSGVGSFQGGADPYDSNTLLALNFASGALTADDTGLQTLTNSGVTYSGSGPANLGDAAAFSGTATASFTSTGFPTSSAQRTLTFWGYPTSTNNTTPFSYGTNSGHGCFLVFIGATALKWYAHDCGAQYGPSTVAPPLSAWHRYDVVVLNTNNTTAFYQDGVEDGYVSNWQYATVLGTGGTLGGGPIGNNWQGSLAALKFAATARTGAWITAEYLNQSAPGTFYAITAAAGPAAVATGQAIVW